MFHIIQLQFKWLSLYWARTGAACFFPALAPAKNGGFGSSRLPNRCPPPCPSPWCSLWCPPGRPPWCVLRCDLWGDLRVDIRRDLRDIVYRRNILRCLLPLKKVKEGLNFHKNMALTWNNLLYILSTLVILGWPACGATCLKTCKKISGRGCAQSFFWHVNKNLTCILPIQNAWIFIKNDHYSIWYAQNYQQLCILALLYTVSVHRFREKNAKH